MCMTSNPLHVSLDFAALNFFNCWNSGIISTPLARIRWKQAKMDTNHPQLSIVQPRMLELKKHCQKWNLYLNSHQYIEGSDTILKKTVPKGHPNLLCIASEASCGRCGCTRLLFGARQVRKKCYRAHWAPTESRRQPARYWYSIPVVFTLNRLLFVHCLSYSPVLPVHHRISVGVGGRVGLCLFDTSRVCVCCPTQ